MENKYQVKLVKSDKNFKNNLRFISKRYVHLQAMTLTFVKFHRIRQKTDGGFTNTKCLESKFTLAVKMTYAQFVKKINLSFIFKRCAHLQP